MWTSLLSRLAENRVITVAGRTALALLVVPATFALKQVFAEPEPATWTIPAANSAIDAAGRAATCCEKAASSEFAAKSATGKRRVAPASGEAEEQEPTWQTAAGSSGVRRRQAEAPRVRRRASAAASEGSRRAPAIPVPDERDPAKPKIRRPDTPREEPSDEPRGDRPAPPDEEPDDDGERSGGDD